MKVCKMSTFSVYQDVSDTRYYIVLWESEDLIAQDASDRQLVKTREVSWCSEY